jgi:hypothetical protein
MFEEFNLALFNQNIFGLNGFNLGFDPNAFTPTRQSNDPSLVTRFIRANEVVFVGTSLTPDKVPNYFLDSTNVNNFVQKSNRLQLANANNAGIFVQGEGIVDITTNVFARVLSSSNNILYLNQNFLTVNIVAFGANTLAATDYAVDDIVTQSVSGVTTFQGRVQYFDSANGILSVSPSSGTMNAHGAVANSVISKLNSTVLSNAVSFIRGNIFPANGNVRSSTNVSNTAQIVSFTHASGAYTAANGTNTLSIVVHANSAGAVGNTLTITSGTGENTIRTIVAVTNNNELVLNATISSLTSNSKYTFGPHVIDEFGRITGIFNIPETESNRFPAGERVFTITDTEGAQNNFFSMRATATYNATGAPPVIQPPVFVPPPVPQPRRDPLAQTFFTPNVTVQIDGAPKTNYGIYVSSVDLFFAGKPILADLQLPVTCQIVTVSNGIPTQNVVAAKTVECKDVKVSTVPDAANSSTITNFKFDDPVYLEPETEYALVVVSDSPDYYLFISELGGTILGSTPPRRVSIQPYVGSLFKSQNSSTWTPIQNQDLMFRIKKCVFNTSGGGTVLFKPRNQFANVNVDSLLLHTTLLNHKPTSSNFKFKSNNVSGTQDVQFTYVPVNTKYSFGADLLTSTATSNRRRRIVRGDANSFIAGVDMNTTDSDMSPLINIERVSLVGYENDINDGSISNTDISITSVGNHINAANIIVTISAPDLSDGVTANAYVSSLSSNGVATIIVDTAGSGYITTPTITLSEPSAPSNATAVIAGETNASGGNMKVRYITKQITLADGFDAGDLRVYLDANRPRGTNIHVYYKVKSASDQENFENKKWKLMNKVQDNFSADQNQIIELEFRPDLEKNILSYVENGVVYPLGGTFKYYAIKIVMSAADPTVVPTVRNFRAIATPSG